VACADQARKDASAQFHHVNDIAPTIYEILGIKPPKVVDGFKQDPIDGVSMAYTFADAKARGRKQTSTSTITAAAASTMTVVRLHVRSLRSLGHGRSSAKLKDWDANKDVWELYNLRNDFSQADDLATREPKRLDQLKALFLKEAKANKAFPIGAGNWLRLHRKTASRRRTRDGSSIRRRPACRIHAPGSAARATG